MSPDTEVKLLRAQLEDAKEDFGSALYALKLAMAELSNLQIRVRQLQGAVDEAASQVVRLDKRLNG